MVGEPERTVSRAPASRVDGHFRAEITCIKHRVPPIPVVGMSIVALVGLIAIGQAVAGGGTGDASRLLIGCLSIVPPPGWERVDRPQGLTTFKSPDVHQPGASSLRDVFTVRQIPSSGLTLSQYREEMARVLAQQAQDIDAAIDGATGHRAKGVGIAGSGRPQFTDRQIDGVAAFEVRLNTLLTADGASLPMFTRSLVLLASDTFYVIAAPVERARLPLVGPTAEAFLGSIRASGCR